jgi:signal transduction histidine kinase
VTAGLATGHTGGMLRAATWLVRTVALVAVGLDTFTGSTAHGLALAVQAIAFGIGAVLVLGWGALTQWWSGRPLAGRLLPWVFGGMAVCSAPGTAKDGGALVAFGFMAALGAGAESSLTTAWLVTAVGLAATVSGAVVVGASTTATLGFALLLIVALLAGRNRQSYRRQAEHASVLLEQSEQLRAEQRQVAVLDERNRIAREIHDVLAHSLGALSIQIQTARALLSDQRDVDRSLSVLEVAQHMAADGLSETRRAVHALRTDTRPLAEELTVLAGSHRDRHHTGVQLNVSGTARALTPDAELALLRTAQESFVNAAKHSGHQPVDARLDYAETQTTLIVTNRLLLATDPAWTAGTTDGGYGLVGMRERLLLLGGSLTAGPDADHWTVTAMVPQ